MKRHDRLQRALRLSPLALICACAPAWAGYVFEDGGFKGELNLGVGTAVIASDGVNFGLGQIDARSGQNKGPRADWVETFFKPGATLNYTFDSGLQLLGGASVIGTHTYGDGDAAGLTRGGDGNVSLEELYGGVRSGAWTFTAGRQGFVVGNGFIIADGHLGMYSEGAYWADPRRAFKDTAILRYDAGPLSSQLFTVRTDSHLGDTRMTGVNLDYALAYGKPGLMILHADDVDPKINAVAPRDGMNLYDARLLGMKVPGINRLTLEAEYAIERGSGKGVQYDASAWYARADYQFSGLPLTPTLSYRYGVFSGDDNLADNTRKSWEPLSKGYMERGAWVIGDITGNYLLNNSNERVGMWKLATQLTPQVGVGGVYYQFALDQKNYLGQAVTDRDFADESSLYVDWTPVPSVYATLSYNWVKPGAAAKQTLGNDTFSAWQVYLSYHY